MEQEQHRVQVRPVLEIRFKSIADFEHGARAYVYVGDVSQGWRLRSRGMERARMSTLVM
jgi:hypothetical protein